MKRVVLILTMLLPAAVIAQQNYSSMPIDRRDTAGSEQTTVAAAGSDEGTLLAASEDAVPPPASSPALEATTQQQTARATPAPSSGEGIDRPKIDGSMVGYIDDAIVGSQIRVRFEAGFGDHFPDLGEFFYAKCGCYNKDLAGTGDYAYDPKAPGPGPGVVTNLNFQQLYFYGEYAVNKRISIFTEVPVRWIQPQSFVDPSAFGTVPNAGGLGDVRAGFKLAPLVSRNYSLTFQFQTYFPSGNASLGLGTNHYSVEPAVLYYQRFSDRLALEAQVGDWHPIGGSSGVPITNSEGFAGDVFFYGIGPSYRVYSGENFSIAPVLEMVGWRVMSGFETVWTSGSDIANPVDGTDIVNLKLGLRMTIGNRNSVYVGYGQALTHADWYEKIVRAEYRFSF